MKKFKQFYKIYSFWIEKKKFNTLRQKKLCQKYQLNQKKEMGSFDIPQKQPKEP